MLVGLLQKVAKYKRLEAAWNLQLNLVGNFTSYSFNFLQIGIIFGEMKLLEINTSANFWLWSFEEMSSEQIGGCRLSFLLILSRFFFALGSLRVVTSVFNTVLWVYF
jgi:hypothetical protein